MNGLLSIPFAHGDFGSFQRQEVALITVNLIVLTALLAVGLAFWPFIGPPSAVVSAFLLVRLTEQLWELRFMRRAEPSELLHALQTHATASVLIHLGFAAAVSMLAPENHSHYTVLYVVPIIAAAFRFNLAGLLLVVGLAVGLSFAEVTLEASRGGTQPVLEYFECTVTCMAYAVVAAVVRLLARIVQNREARLHDSLERLAATQARLVAEERLAAVGRMSAALAHEIRNPAAMILASLEEAREAQSPEQQARMREIMRSEIGRLERLTSDFLTYARGRQPEPETGDLAVSLGYAAEIARPIAAAKSVSITCNGGPVLASFDQHQVHQALLNLVRNAVEASLEGGEVLLAVRAEESSAIASVCNGGPPIPDETVARLFEPFTSTKPGGNGLGLAVSRAIARAHGGDLVLATNSDSRVCFELRLPLQPPTSHS
jgi:signal transduction histidine kinase